jgi:hypothetical protein
MLSVSLYPIAITISSYHCFLIHETNFYALSNNVSYKVLLGLAIQGNTLAVMAGNLSLKLFLFSLETSVESEKYQAQLSKICKQTNYVIPFLE